MAYRYPTMQVQTIALRLPPGSSSSSEIQEVQTVGNRAFFGDCFEGLTGLENEVLFFGFNRQL
jgi:hypothetical protein